MRKKIFLIFFIICNFLHFNFTSSSEVDVYKKIDLFGEVLEKINKVYVDEIDQSESIKTLKDKFCNMWNSKIDNFVHFV